MQKNNVVPKIKNAIIKYNLAEKNDKILIGLSGGADSVCLTHALYSLSKELNITLIAAHLNHNIRGDEAKRDADFARDFAKSLDIPFVYGSADVVEYAKATKKSQELAAREIRYSFFNDVLTSMNINKIATAHNKNDNAETVIMNFTRGTSLSGLCGIPYKRDNIIRPLLDVTREEIEDYCKEFNLSYVTDSTNLLDEYTRNKVRHNLIPKLLDINPNFINTVSKNAEIMKAEDDYISIQAKDKYNELVNNSRIATGEFLKLHKALQRRILRYMISDVIEMSDISSDFCDDIIELVKNNKTGSFLNLPKDTVARIEYGELVIEKDVKTEDYEYSITIGKETEIKEAKITVLASYTDKQENDGCMYFSGEGLDKIKIRNRRNGDYFYPLGMNGKKKLKDYFIDSKVPRIERQKTPILTFNDEIACIIGYRCDNRFKFKGKGIKLQIKYNK